MIRESPHEFPAAQVLMDLAVNRPLRTRSKDGGSLHVCLDKKVQQNALNNYLISHTPYRCSLGRPKETMDAKQRARQPNKVRSQNPASELSLPRIPSVSESLIGRTATQEDSTSRQTIKRLIDLESEEEEEQPCNVLSCKSVKDNQSHIASRPTINPKKESRSRSLPLILKKGHCSTCLKTGDDMSDKSLDKAQNGESYSPTRIVSVHGSQENGSLHDQEYTTVMEDGAKVTVCQHRLFIEVFMPRTS